MVKAGRVHRTVREAAKYGTVVQGTSLDWAALIARQRRIVARLRPPVADLEKTGARVALGAVRFVDPHTVQADGARLQADKIVIAAGSEPVIPGVAGGELGITSDQVLFLPEFPDSLVLVGGGVIALEMAGAFADLGSRVTVLGRDAEILPNLDPDVAGYLRAMLEARGVIFRLDATLERLEGRPGAVTVHARAGGEALAIPAAQVCFAIGRRFHPRMVGAESLGLETAGLGLRVTPYLRTSMPHIYAAGDAAGNRQLTPVAAAEGKIAAANALRGDSVRTDEAVIPQAIFTTPEAASVGLSHRQTEERGIRCEVARHDMRGASNGLASGEDGGYLKLVLDHATGRLIGAQMVSYAAAELIQFCALAIRSRMTASAVAEQLSIHPSHGERLVKAFGADLREICEP
ncbi:MAG TPA: NAD(P)/FAD-dependent oxidoreductase [Methylomirabilota bacterium]|nr:NAD(P)/FAD-dependent oxidoreductase [Methylomirabilota bacterium]